MEMVGKSSNFSHVTSGEICGMNNQGNGWNVGGAIEPKYRTDE
jgi:hypothetical protein